MHVGQMQTGISGENLVDVGDQKCSSSVIHIPTEEAVVFQINLCRVAVECLPCRNSLLLCCLYCVLWKKK